MGCGRSRVSQVEPGQSQVQGLGSALKTPGPQACSTTFEDQLPTRLTCSQMLVAKSVTIQLQCVSKVGAILRRCPPRHRKA